MPMTPDEVVKECMDRLTGIFSYGLSIKQTQALSSAISFLQDYQKLRERIDLEKITNILIYTREESYDVQAQQIVKFLERE